MSSPVLVSCLVLSCFVLSCLVLYCLLSFALFSCRLVLFSAVLSCLVFFCLIFILLSASILKRFVNCCSFDLNPQQHPVIVRRIERQKNYVEFLRMKKVKGPEHHPTAHALQVGACPISISSMNLFQPAFTMHSFGKRLRVIRRIDNHHFYSSFLYSSGKIVLHLLTLTLTPTLTLVRG